MDNIDNKNKSFTKPIIWGLVLFLLIVLLFNSYTIINGGERGVVFSKTTGVQSIVLDEGFNLKKPFIDSIIRFEVRTTKYDLLVASTSADQQIVQATIALNYRLNPETVNKLYQEVGRNYQERIVKPALAGAIKTGMAKFKAEELIQNRDQVTLEIIELLNKNLEGKHIIVDNVNIINIDFSEKYDAAIEAKVEAEQEAKKAENQLVTTKIEKEKTIVQAEAQKEKSILEAQAKAEAILIQAQSEAEAIKIKQEALSKSSEVLDYKWIETWDGKLPTYYGNGNENLLLTIKQEE